ncbi:attractin-like protein 1 [Rhincodon typus]|uniref:attractin-like protein 1 n=1 Tax=Rhincodon typus TaxID=259920 RepID=UPI00202E09F3|nr:attractin-like protein 1 [Rhincodon typus]
MAAANGGGNPQTGPGLNRLSWSKGALAVAARDSPDPYRSGICYALLYLVVSARMGLCRDCDKTPCIYGRCVNGSCICDQGWVGEQCQHCGGRFNEQEFCCYCYRVNSSQDSHTLYFIAILHLQTKFTPINV